MNITKPEKALVSHPLFLAMLAAVAMAAGLWVNYLAHLEISVKVLKEVLRV